MSNSESLHLSYSLLETNKNKIVYAIRFIHEYRSGFSDHNRTI